MAKVDTTNTLLNDILVELESLSKIQKENNKEKEKSGKSNAPTGIFSKIFGDIKEKDTAGAKSLATTLGALGSSINILSRVSEKQVKSAVNVITAISSSVKSIKMNANEMKLAENMLKIFKLLTDTVMPLMNNFFKNILKFNPITGTIIGKSLGGYMKNLLKGFESEKIPELLKTLKNGPSGTVLSGFSELLKVLFSIDYKNLRRIGRVLNRFPAKAGENLTNFFKPILKMLDKEFPNDKKVLSDKIDNLKSLIDVLTKFTFGNIIILWTMGKFLGKKTGKAIGEFFSELIKNINKSKESEVKNAVDVAKSTALLISALTLSFITLVIVAAIFKPKTLLIAAGMLVGLIGLSFIIIKFFSAKEVQKESKQALYTAGDVAILLLALTACLAITVALAKHTKLADLLVGFGILGLLIGVSFIIIKFLSTRSILESTAQSILTVLGIGVMLILLSATLSIVVAVAKKNKIADIILGTIMMVALVFGMIGLILFASKMDKKSLILGLATVGLITVGVMLLSAAMMVYTKYLEKIADISLKDILKGTAVAAAVIAGVGAAVFAVGALITGPQALFFAAGAVALATISGLIMLISASILRFGEMVKFINENLTMQTIKNATEMITSKNGGMVGCIKAIVSELSDIGILASIRMAAVGKALNPVFDSLSKFVDVIQKMAKMSILDHYDEKGNPVYRPMKPSEFTDAAENISKSFSIFLTKLFDAFEGDRSAKKMKSILKALRKGGVSQVMDGLSKFVDVIQKMASAIYACEWDETGKATKYIKLTNTDFIKAAVTLTVCFTTFLTELNNAFDSPKQVKKMKKILKTLKKGNVASLMQGIGSFVDAIMKMASAHVAVEWDNDGRAIKYLKLSDADFMKAADTLTTTFCAFLDRLDEEFDEDKGKSAKRIRKIIKNLTKAGIDKLMASIGSFIDPVMQIASGSLLVGEKVIEITEDKLKTAGTTIASIFTNVLTPLSTLGEDLDDDNIKTVADCMETIISIVPPFLELKVTESNFYDNTKEFYKGLAMLRIALQKIDKEKWYGSNLKNFTKTMDSMMDIAGKLIKLEIFKNLFSVNCSELVNGYDKLFEFIRNKNIKKSEVDAFIDRLGLIHKTTKKIMPLLKVVPKRLDTTTDALVKFDAELINKDKARVAAINNMTKAFNNVGTSLKELNNDIARSNDLIERYGQLEKQYQTSIFATAANDMRSLVEKMMQKDVEAAKDAAERAASAAEHGHNSIGGGSSDGLNSNMDMLAVTITEALNKWLETDHMINVELGNNSPKIIGSIIGQKM